MTTDLRTTQWYRRCLFLSRMGAWEELWKVYLPVQETHTQHPFFKGPNPQWQTVFPLAYWRWLRQDGNEHKHPHKQRT